MDFKTLFQNIAFWVCTMVVVSNIASAIFSIARNILVVLLWMWWNKSLRFDTTNGHLTWDCRWWCIVLDCWTRRIVSATRRDAMPEDFVGFIREIVSPAVNNHVNEKQGCTTGGTRSGPSSATRSRRN